MNLVAFVGKEKENWGQITALINHSEAEKIILIQDKTADPFPSNHKCKTFHIDSTKPLTQLTLELKEKLKTELSSDFEVALSIASGTGKDHMALVSALLSVPVGIKLVAYTKEGIKFLT